MTLPFQLSNNLDFDNVHQFRVYEVQDADNPDWLIPLAREYIKLLTHREAKVRNIAVRAGDTLMNPSTIQKYLLKASLPKFKQGNFNVVRSDFGELLCYLLLERDYQTLLGAKSICYRELRDSSGKGIDAIGVEIETGELLSLVLCEVKVSDEQTSPPRVVDSNNDSLSHQHTYHLTKLFEDTKDKIWRVARLTRDANTASLLEAAALCLEERNLDALRIVICNVLIRPIAEYKSTDFGSFFRKPDQYQPASIRFLIPCIPQTANAIIERWYKLLQEMEVSV